MTAVFIRDRSTIADLLRRRHEQGLDLLDEIWNGVLHMSPPPHIDHQEIVTWLGEVIRVQARRHALGKVYVQGGIREPGTPSEGQRANYRVPDVVLLPNERAQAASASGWVEDGASLVIEVRSPREEFDEKLTFYAARGIGEALWIDRSTKDLALFRLFARSYRAVAPADDGSLLLQSAHLRVTRIHLGTVAPCLRFEDAKGGGPLPPL